MALGLYELINNINKQIKSICCKIENLDPGGGGGGSEPAYKVYTALLSQFGTDAPVATVLENTIGIEPIFTYGTPGNYQMEFPGLFPIAEGYNKTAVFYKNNSSNQSIPITQVQQNFPSTNVFTIYSRASVTHASFTAGQQYNTIMNGTIEIRVYN
jgi:hypothetical protein